MTERNLIDGNNCICNPVVEIVDFETLVDSIVRTRNCVHRRADARAAGRAGK